MSDRATRLVILALTLGFALAPWLSSGFGGFYRESFPVQVDRWPAQPAGWAFAIWGLIYLALILTAVLALGSPGRVPGWRRAAGPLGLSLSLGLFWIEAATRAPVLATAMILPMALGAILAMGRLGPGWRAWGAVGLFAGWLTAASGVAVSVVLTGHGLMGPRAAALLVLAAVLAAALWVARRYPAVWTYRAGVIWALIGVLAANLQAGDRAVAALAGLGIALLAAPGLITVRRSRTRP